ncbi:MAG: HPr family phosphocarrier protein [Lachnospiraceae bacterium]|nr:HPr family phosphocarrier protein [Lachnospiraceae bacterium]
MKTMTVTVSLSGLNAHEIAMSVQTASRFRSEIHLTDGERRMNAKSIMGMMALGLALGDEVTIEANGPDEEEAAYAMASYLQGENEAG